MIPINEVRQTCFDLAAKQQHGFPATNEWNRMANLANIDLYNYWNDIRRKQVLELRMGIQLSVPAALNPFLEIDKPLQRANGVFLLPNGADETAILTIGIGENKANVRIVDYNRRNNILNSSIDGPTEDAPIAMQKPGALVVYPEDVTSIYASYLKLPVEVKWGYTLDTSRRQVYSDTLSVDFQWNITEKVKLVMRILNYMGISIREPELTQYAEQQNQLSN